MTRRLGEVVVDLGVHSAGDAAAPCDLPQPTGGRKEYTDESGKVVKVVERFG